jgi:2',3'-cyclic-nucleotide 2'-phosphodiesterase (5'-nucleotidase family)
LKLSVLIFFGAGLMACSSFHTTSVNIQGLPVDSLTQVDHEIDQIISPYRDTIQREMGVEIATSPMDAIVARPSSILGNWVSDAIFVDQTKTVRLRQPVMCLLNTGGIRSSINKGSVTLGDIFRVMPFDNEIVWVELPSTVLPDIVSYLRKSTGEPISNARIEKGNLSINGWRDTTTRFWIITSDYLANGGDKMTFFRQALNVNRTGRLMRDALIDQAKSQVSLVFDSTMRIYW